MRRRRRTEAAVSGGTALSYPSTTGCPCDPLIHPCPALFEDSCDLTDIADEEVGPVRPVVVQLHVVKSLGDISEQTAKAYYSGHGFPVQIVQRNGASDFQHLAKRSCRISQQLNVLLLCGFPSEHQYIGCAKSKCGRGYKSLLFGAAFTSIGNANRNVQGDYRTDCLHPGTDCRPHLGLPLFRGRPNPRPGHRGRCRKDKQPYEREQRLLVSLHRSHYLGLAG